VEALARALRVSDAERDLLFRLAGHATLGLGIVSSHITPSVQRLLDRLANTPVAVSTPPGPSLSPTPRTTR
jgi:hypothetical protein